MTATSMINNMAITPPAVLRIPVENKNNKCNKIMFKKTSVNPNDYFVVSSLSNHG